MVESGSDQKQFLYFFTLRGCGNHLAADLFSGFGYTRVPGEMLHFWPTYVLAQRAPGIRCPFKPYTDRSALEAVRAYYADFGLGRVDRPLDPELSRVFLEAALDRVEGNRLLGTHCFPFSSSRTYVCEDGETVRWSLQDRDRAIALFQDALERSDYDERYIGLIRHPADIYSSVWERFGNTDEPGEVKRRIHEFFALVDAREHPDSFLVLKYEDLCLRKPEVFCAILEYLNLRVLANLEAELGFLHTGEVWKHRTMPAQMRDALLDEFREWIDRFDYHVPYSDGFLGRVSARVGKFRNEVHTLNLVFRGEHRAGSALFRHRRSTMGQAYLDMCWSLFPSFRRNFRAIYENHFGAPCEKSYGVFHRVMQKAARAVRAAV